MADPAKEERAKQWLISNNKCASKSSAGFLCTLTANHIGRRHKAQVMGGAEDGKTLQEWDW